MKRNAISLAATLVALLTLANPPGLRAEGSRCDDNLIKAILDKKDIGDNDQDVKKQVDSGHITIKQEQNITWKKDIKLDPGNKLCQKPVWDFIMRDNPKGLGMKAPAWGALTLASQIDLLKKTSGLFGQIDAQFQNVVAAATAVYGAAEQLGVKKATKTDQSGPGGQYPQYILEDVTAPPPANDPASMRARSALLQSLIKKEAADDEKAEAGELMRQFYLQVGQLQAVILTAKATLEFVAKGLNLVPGTPQFKAMDSSTKLLGSDLNANQPPMSSLANATGWGDQAVNASLMGLIDPALRNQVWGHVFNVHDLLGSLNTKVKDTSANGFGGTVTGFATQNEQAANQLEAQAKAAEEARVKGEKKSVLEDRLRAKTLDELGLKSVYDKAGRDATKIADPDQRAAVQAVLAGKLAETKSGSGQYQFQYSKPGAKAPSAAPGAPVLTLDAANDELAKTVKAVADDLSNGNPMLAKLRAAAHAANPAGEDPPVTPRWRLPGAGFLAENIGGKKSGCAVGESPDDYKKRMEKERREASAAKSADRKAAYDVFNKKCGDAEKEFQAKSEPYKLIAASQDDFNSKVKEFKDKKDSICDEAEKDLNTQLDKLGTEEQQAAQDTANELAQSSQIETDIRTRVEAQIGVLRDDPEQLNIGATKLKDLNAADRRPFLDNYFSDTWTSGKDSYEDNLAKCIAGARRQRDVDSAVTDYVGKDLVAYINGKTAGSYSTSGSESEAARRLKKLKDERNKASGLQSQ